MQLGNQGRDYDPFATASDILTSKCSYFLGCTNHWHGWQYRVAQQSHTEQRSVISCGTLRKLRWRFTQPGRLPLSPSIKINSGRSPGPRTKLRARTAANNPSFPAMSPNQGFVRPTLQRKRHERPLHLSNRCTVFNAQKPLRQSCRLVLCTSYACNALL